MCQDPSLEGLDDDHQRLGGKQRFTSLDYKQQSVDRRLVDWSDSKTSWKDPADYWVLMRSGGRQQQEEGGGEALSCQTIDILILEKKDQKRYRM